MNMFTESLEVSPFGNYQILRRGDVHIFNNLGAFLEFHNLNGASFFV